MSKDEYLAFDFTDITTPHPIDRRDFLKQLGGGIVILISAGSSLFAQQHGSGGRSRRGTPADFNAFLRIGEDGRVTGFTGKVEMGQGVITSLAQMLADELDVPFDSVDLVMGDTDLCPWDMGTFGSMTTRFFGPAFQKAAAEARSVLLELAAERLQVKPDRLQIEQGVVFVQASPEQRVTYSELTQGKTITRRVGSGVSVKPHSQHTLVGSSEPRPDATDKVTGKAVFTGDIRLPGMLYGRILRPPAHGATLTSVDTSRAETMDGVRVVRDGDFIGVLHEAPDEAARALSAITARFDVPEARVDEQTIFDHLLAVAPAGQEIDAGGDLEQGEGLASSVIEGTYLGGYVAHAPIETHTAVAQVEEDHATVWASTQTPFRARDQVADELGLESSQVRIITPFLGGGFGGKGVNPQVVEAARLSQLAGVPVHLEWTRAEEFFYDSFRPASVVKIRSGIDDAGRLTFWDYGVHQAGERGSRQFYDIPHHRTLMFGSGWRGASGTHPFNTGAWRAPACSNNTFARESQIDLMAARAKCDPIEFRLTHLRDERMIRVLKAAAQKFDWKPAAVPSRRGVGVACGIDSGSYVAQIAQVEVDRDTGKVRVVRVVCAQDMGEVINPEGAIMQVEGCITMSLGYALSEEIRFQGGAIADLDFSSYRLPRFSWVPEIETVLIDDREAPPQGGGEPAIICMGALLANAIHDAVGVRLYQIPLTPERVREAIEDQG